MNAWIRFGCNCILRLRRRVSVYATLALVLLVAPFATSLAANYSENFDDGAAQGWTNDWTINDGVYYNSHNQPSDYLDLSVYSGASWTTDYTYHARLFDIGGSVGNKAGMVFNYQ